MSLKHLAHKAKRSLKRAAHGKFHSSHVWYRKGIERILPSRLRSQFKRLSWGRIKKSHRLGLRHLLGAGNNNATSLYVDAGGYQPGGYVYNGRTISEMM